MDSRGMNPDLQGNKWRKNQATDHYTISNKDKVDHNVFFSGLLVLVTINIFKCDFIDGRLMAIIWSRMSLGTQKTVGIDGCYIPEIKTQFKSI